LDLDDTETILDALRGELDNILQWMRVGYQQAQERYGEQGKAESLFESIRREVDNAVRGLNLESLKDEGAYFNLTYGMDGATMTVEYEWENECYAE